MALDWNDIRVLVAVLEHGSTRRAAAALGVEQTTCARRIAALEHALDVKLFQRDSSGYQPTASALALRDVAVEAAEKVAAFERMARAEGRRVGGPLRITCEEVFARTVVAPAVHRFSELSPDLVVEIDVSNAYRDLNRGEADLAIRPGREPDEPSLIQRKLGEDCWDVYCSAAYAQMHGAPATPGDLPGHPLVCFEPALELTRAAGLGAFIRHVTNTVGATLALIESGACIGGLPRSVAKESERLTRCFAVPEAQFGVWLIYPERLRDTPAVRALAALIADQFTQHYGSREAPVKP